MLSVFVCLNAWCFCQTQNKHIVSVCVHCASKYLVPLSLSLSLYPSFRNTIEQGIEAQLTYISHTHGHSKTSPQNNKSQYVICDLFSHNLLMLSDFSLLKKKVKDLPCVSCRTIMVRTVSSQLRWSQDQSMGATNLVWKNVDLLWVHIHCSPMFCWLRHPKLPIR